MSTQQPTLILVVCAAPPAAAIGELAALLRQQDWDVLTVATEAATEWIDAPHVEAATGYPVRSRPRSRHEAKELPTADAIVVAPATFNTINQWAAGINNTAALGVLNGALGAAIPIIASPYAKPTLAAHPAFERSLRLLTDVGVHFTATDALRPTTTDGPFAWDCILEPLRRRRSRG